MRPLVDRLLDPWSRRGREAVFTLPGALTCGAGVLVLDSGDLADLIFHGPLLHGLRAGVPDLRVDVLLPEAHAQFMAASGLAQTCLTYRPAQLRPFRRGFFPLLRAARAGGYAATIIASHDPQPALARVAMAAGAPLRLGPSHANAWPAVNLEIRRGVADATYRGNRPAAALPLLGLPAPLSVWRWPLPPERLRQIRQLVRFNKNRPDDRLVAIDPGAGKNGPALALSSLQFLAGQLAGQLSCQIVPLSADGGERVRELTALLPVAPPALPRADLLETALLLSQCDLFLGGNTDLFHLAVSLGVPAVGLFTEEDGADWEPRGRPAARGLRVARGARVDAEALFAAVAAVGIRVAPRAAAAADGAAAWREGAV